MGVVGFRLVVATACTVAVATIGVACGADGPPRTALDRGEGIYQANCAQCHGGDVAGSARGPSLLDPIYGPEQLTDAEFADAITNVVDEQRWDFGAMPANGSITDEQIAAILTFVRTQQAGDPPG
jgi:mono/diheme cytochrome c family protein